MLFDAMNKSLNLLLFMPSLAFPFVVLAARECSYKVRAPKERLFLWKMIKWPAVNKKCRNNHFYHEHIYQNASDISQENAESQHESNLCRYFILQKWQIIELSRSISFIYYAPWCYCWRIFSDKIRKKTYITSRKEI